jgi:predicted RecB family nuclease
MAQLKEADDLTLIPELGRSRRDAMSAHIRSVQAFSKADLEPLVNGRKTVIPGIGPETLVKFHTRAKLLADPESGPFLTSPVRLPRADSELFFDIETDPMRDVCYLHGFLIRRNRDRRTERYVAFFSDDPSPEAEKKAFADAWAYVRSCRPCVIYYYSPYERTFWRKLQNRYPDVVDAGGIERMFSPDTAVDLYQDVVKSKTEWPTYDYSIKTLATFLGFHWRDTNPSGAASIEWFHRWIETRNPALRLRILQYNEDDCIATRVLLDAIHRLPLKP